MDIYQIKKIIKESLSAQIKKITNERRLPPKNFENFVDLVETASEDFKVINDKSLLHSIWLDIEQDMAHVKESHLVKEWNDLISYYSHRFEFPEKFESQIIKRILK